MRKVLRCEKNERLGDEFGANVFSLPSSRECNSVKSVFFTFQMIQLNPLSSLFFIELKNRFFQRLTYFFISHFCSATEK